MKIIQVSDLHIVPPGIRLLGYDPRARLEACIADINARHGDGDYCLFTGDLADRGAPEAYASLREALGTLALPYRLLIGNHDHRENFKAAFPDEPVDSHGFVQSSLSLPEGELLMLDTNEPGQGWGSYCARRCAWLQARLEAAAGRPVYIFMHHPPFKISIPSLDAIRLVESEGFAGVVAGFTNLRHLFFGHVHRPVSGAWRGIPYSALRSLVHQVPLDFETERPVPYSHAQPNYAVILIEDGQITVHLHDFLSDTPIDRDQPRYSEAE